MQDQDVAEIYEQSVEIMELNEEVSDASLTSVQLGKKISFYEICQRMIQSTDDESNKWKHIQVKGGSGDACCSSGDLTAEQKICQLVPKLNEVLYEILSEDPYHRANTINCTAGAISIKQQAIIESIQGFTQRLLHNVHYIKSPRRTLSLKGSVKGLNVGEQMRRGDLMTFDIAIEKIPGLKSCCSHRLWLALINQTSREVQIEEFR